MRLLEWSRPHVSPTAPAGAIVIGREGVVKMVNSSSVPRVTRHGTRQEAACVVSEVGDDHLHNLLWKLGGCRCTCGGHFRGTSSEQPLDCGLGSVPKLVNEEFARYRSVSAMR